MGLEPSIIVRSNKAKDITVSQANRALVQGNITHASGISQSSNTNTTISLNLQGNTYG